MVRVDDIEREAIGEVAAKNSSESTLFIRPSGAVAAMINSANCLMTRASGADEAAIALCIARIFDIEAAGDVALIMDSSVPLLARAIALALADILLANNIARRAKGEVVRAILLPIVFCGARASGAEAIRKALASDFASRANGAAVLAMRLAYERRNEASGLVVRRMVFAAERASLAARVDMAAMRFAADLAMRDWGDETAEQDWLNIAPDANSKLAVRDGVFATSAKLTAVRAGGVYAIS